MQFLRYRHGWAWGYSDWEIKLVTQNFEVIEDDVLEDILDTLKDENNWSDKYRGLEYDIITKPPKEWLSTQVGYMTTRIVGLQDLASKYKQMVTNYDSDV